MTDAPTLSPRRSPRSETSCWLKHPPRGEGGTTIIQKDFDLSYLPEPQERRQQIALALMREARSINHGAYAFLNFYRALEVAVPNGKRRSRWLSDHVDRLTEHQAKLAVAELRAEGVADAVAGAAQAVQGLGRQ